MRIVHLTDRLTDRGGAQRHLLSVVRALRTGPLRRAIGWFNATACLILSAVIALYFALPPRLWRGKP